MYYPGKLCGGDALWMGLTNRWDLDCGRVPVGKRKGFEDSRSWAV
jgi:hypothetical protein